VPFAKGAKALERALFGGWVVGGNVSWSSGPLITINNAFAIGNPGLDHPTFQRWFNSCTINTAGQRVNCANSSEQAAWQIIPPSTLTNSNPRQTSIRRYRPMQATLSAFKNFKVWERVKMEFRAEAFNAFNTPEFGDPNTTATSSLFGVVSNTQANDPRAI